MSFTVSPNIAVTRRRALQIGTTGILGLSLPQWLALQAQAAAGNGRAAAKNVLVILEQGGLSHIDTWDPKPEAPVDHRSPHRPIDTNVPGIQFTSLLPRTSQIAHHLSVIRSMWHAKSGANGHPDGTQYVLSGSHPSSPLEMPDIGCIATRLLGSDCRELPPYIMVPGNHEQHAATRTGFLPAASRVFKTGGRDLSDPQWQVADLRPLPSHAGRRLEQRKQILTALDAGFSRGNEVAGMERFYSQAFDTLTSSRVDQVFNLANESVETRDLYGQGHRGACYLVGRKLIEAGVRFVTVDVRWPLTPEVPGGNNLNWDHHDLIYTSASCGTIRDKAGGEGRYGIGHWVMMGSTDHAFAGLIRDLDQRGLLAETLVCFVTEFGRTPRLNKFQGRDHWTSAYSIVLAGAGVPGGQIIGQTDEEGGHVLDAPYTPENYAATIYEKLGVDRSSPLHTNTNRPVFFSHGAEPIRGVL
ncbi:MAG: DUF1501 domain-containing protein [Planctomycetota bacterium]|nr:MAG: DUF1501 domain-containing protein [Planctomycetota bacterium]